MEEGPVSRNEVVGLASGLVLYIVKSEIKTKIDGVLTVISI